MSDPLARIQRALTADKFIRFSALDASPLWDGVRRGHPHLEPWACAVLVEVMGGALLLQARTFFEDRLQVLVRSSGRAKTVVADAWPDGAIRGVLDVGPNPQGSWIEGPGLFQVMRSRATGEPTIGNLELVEGPIQTQVEAYLQQSEQVQASCTLWCDPETGEAGGLLVEPLPDCPPERLARLVDALDGLDVVPHWERDPDFLARWINQGDGWSVLCTTEVACRCRCSQASLLGTLAGFPEARLVEVFSDAEPVEVHCDYCNRTYLLTRDQVQAFRSGGGHGA